MRMVDGMGRARRVLGVSALLGIGCGGSTQDATHLVGSPSPHADAGASESDGGNATVTSTDAATGGACSLPPTPADLCGALPTGKVTPCSADSSGKPSQTGYLEIDSPGSAPMYVCATSWSSDQAIGYIFGQPETFLSQSEGCCGGTVSATAAPTVPSS